MRNILDQLNPASSSSTTMRQEFQEANDQITGNDNETQSYERTPRNDDRDYRGSSRSYHNNEHREREQYHQVYDTPVDSYAYHHQQHHHRRERSRSRSPSRQSYEDHYATHERQYQSYGSHRESRSSHHRERNSYHTKKTSSHFNRRQSHRGLSFNRHNNNHSPHEKTVAHSSSTTERKSPTSVSVFSMNPAHFSVAPLFEVHLEKITIMTSSSLLLQEKQSSLSSSSIEDSTERKPGGIATILLYLSILHVLDTHKGPVSFAVVRNPWEHMDSFGLPFIVHIVRRLHATLNTGIQRLSLLVSGLPTFSICLPDGFQFSICALPRIITPSRLIQIISNTSKVFVGNNVIFAADISNAVTSSLLDSILPFLSVELDSHAIETTDSVVNQIGSEYFYDLFPLLKDSVIIDKPTHHPTITPYVSIPYTPITALSTLLDIFQPLQIRATQCFPFYTPPHHPPAIPKPIVDYNTIMAPFKTLIQSLEHEYRPRRKFNIIIGSTPFSTLHLNQDYTPKFKIHLHSHLFELVNSSENISIVILVRFIGKTASDIEYSVLTITYESPVDGEQPQFVFTTTSTIMPRRFNELIRQRFSDICTTSTKQIPHQMRIIRSHDKSQPDKSIQGALVYTQQLVLQQFNRGVISNPKAPSIPDDLSSSLKWLNSIETSIHNEDRIVSNLAQLQLNDTHIISCPATDIPAFQVDSSFLSIFNRSTTILFFLFLQFTRHPLLCRHLTATLWPVFKSLRGSMLRSTPIATDTLTQFQAETDLIRESFDSRETTLVELFLAHVFQRKPQTANEIYIHIKLIVSNFSEPHQVNDLIRAQYRQQTTNIKKSTPQIVILELEYTSIFAELTLTDLTLFGDTLFTENPNNINYELTGIIHPSSPFSYFTTDYLFCRTVSNSFHRFINSTPEPASSFSLNDPFVNSVVGQPKILVFFPIDKTVPIFNFRPEFDKFYNQ